MGILRRIFGGGGKKKNQPPSSPGGSTSHPDNKRRWSFARSSNTATKNNNNKKRADAGGATQMYDDSLDANKHAIAVAAATAAVAEAALAAAHAAAEVVRLTSAGGAAAAAAGAAAVSAGGRSAAHPPQPPRVGGSQRRWAEESAAVKIQSAFRGYLARRALRALKALVKLQALVRGHIVRKQTADMLRRMQTLVRLQARARASRSSTPESWHSFGRSSHSRLAVPAASPHKDQPFRACSAKFDGPSVLRRCGSHANFRDIIDVEKARIGSNWLDRWMEESLWNNHGSSPLRGRHADDEKSDKILEVDTWKPHMKSQQSNRTLSQHVLASDHINTSFMTSDSPTKLSTRAPSVSSGEVLSYNSLKLPLDKDDSAYRTAENSPHVFCSSSRPGSSGRRGAFTPTRSEYSWNIFNGYSGYPNYMANTESSRAKVRSQSAPRLRLEFDRYGSSRRSTHGFSDADTRSERGYVQHTDFWNKAYPASGRLNRLGSSNLRS